MVDHVTYNLNKTGINDYLEKFILPDFPGECFHLKEDFSEILRSKEEKIHIQFDYRIFLIPYYLLLVALLKMRGKEVIVTMHSYIHYSEAKNAFESYFADSFPLRLFSDLRLVILGVWIFNKINKLLPDKLIFHSQYDKIPSNKNIEDVPHPIHENQEDKRQILFFGRLYRYKGFDLLVETAELLPEFNFVVVFSEIDLNAEEIKKSFEKAKEMENIDLLYNISDSLLRMLIKNSDCVLLPFKGALGFSNALGKSIYYEKITVTTREGIFEDLDFLIKAEKDPRDIADKVKKALDLGEDEKDEIKTSMRKYREYNSLEKFISQHRSVYE